MKLATLLAALVVILASLPSCSRTVRTPVSDIRFRMRDFHFRSGLRVVVEEDHTAPVVGVVAIVGAGSTSDPRSKEGLAHLVEHLTFRAQHTGTQSLSSLLDQAGASDWNAGTSFDKTSYYAFGPRDALLDLLLVEGARILDPLANVDEKTFAVERDVVRNELRERNETNASGAVWAAVLKSTFPPNHPYARSIIGTHESLSSITLADARAFAKQHYRPSNTTLLVIGDVRLETIDKVLEAALSPELSQPASSPPPKQRLTPQAPEPPAPPPAAGIFTVEGPISTPELYITWSLPRSYDEASYVNDFAIGGALAAIDEVSEADADILSASATIADGSLASTLVCRVLLRKGEDPARSANYILDQLDRNGTKPETERELLRRRGRAATRMLVDAEDIVTRGLDRAAYIHFSGDTSLYSRRFQAMSTLDVRKLGAIYTKYVNRDRARIVLVNPIPASKRLPSGRTGVAEPLEASHETAAYDVASIAKVAVPVGLAKNFHRGKLGNGLVVESARHGDRPLVVVGLGFRGGTALEPRQGAAQLATSTALPIVRYGRFSDHAATMHWRANMDGVQFTIQAPSFALVHVLDILAGHVAHLRVTADSLDAFEHSLLPFLRRQQRQPEEVAYRGFRRALFGSHPYSHTGEIPDDKLPDDYAANDWMESIITPSNAVLAIVGDVDAEEAQRMAREAFADWSGKPVAAAPQPLGAAGTGALIVTPRPGASQAEVTLGCRLPPADAAGALGNQVLAQALGARVAAVRSDAGTTYGLRADASTYAGGSSVLYVRGDVANAGLAGALRAIRIELSGREVVTEFDHGRWAVARGYNLRLATASDWVERALSLGRLGWTLETEDEIPRTLASLDAAKLVAPLRRCATEGVLSIVGDEPTIRRAVAEAWK